MVYICLHQVALHVIWCHQLALPLLLSNFIVGSHKFSNAQAFVVWDGIIDGCLYLTLIFLSLVLLYVIVAIVETVPPNY